MRATLLSRTARPALSRATTTTPRASSSARDPHTTTKTTKTTTKPIVVAQRRGNNNNARSSAERRLRRRARLQQQQPVEMPLPGGALWLLDRDLPDPLLGDGFVLRRADDEWAWVDHKASSSQPPPQPSPRRPLALPPPLFSHDPKLLPYQRECLALVSVPVGDDEAAQLGIVPWQDPEQQQEEPELSDADAAMQAFLFGSPPLDASSSTTWDQSKSALDPIESTSPRRTARIRFTCRRCGATTQRPVNPHAWRRGTVFATCGGCGVTHKLVDNLKLFHELSGPVFGGVSGGADGAGLTPPPIAAEQQQQPTDNAEDADLPIISTDFRAGRWAADGELGLPLGLRWLVEEGDENEGDKSGGGPAQA